MTTIPKPGGPLAAVTFAIEAAEEGGFALKRITVTMDPTTGGISDIDMQTIAYRTELHEVNDLMAKKMAQTFGASPYPPVQQPQLTYQQPRAPAQGQPFMGPTADYPAGVEPMTDRPAVLDDWTNKGGSQPGGTLNRLRDRITNGAREHASALVAFLTLTAISLAQHPIA